ncbi:ABC transporter substrate-binding protein [Synoicihabitans lomoniglobus]|uniref:ABC transporter substrate-binding protein n=1 Tax=Synoicihabitans lomoniglobus TaxID=2909285 RepID=A0AAF0A127_9BACT|nr:ABC transporter substrate-binding protein [Opitutaceae bacterium LMO-M01]WED65398.1 ABC transporter substrate-binding protein [Opitutaceae bacterium LMO-M01]
MNTDGHRFRGTALQACLGLSVFICGCFLGGLKAEAADPIRVVSQTVGTDELLLAVADAEQIAALSHLAAETEFSAVVAEARDFPLLTKGGDAETILKYRPTHVLVADYSRADLVAQLERAGIVVMKFTKYHTLDDAFENLRWLAEVLGPEAEARAERVIADTQARSRALATRLDGVRLVKVIAPSTYGVIGGAGTTFQDLCDHAGGENLASTVGGLTGHEPTPRESMLTWPVEKVVVAGKDRAMALEPYARLAPYQFMAAVKDGRVALIEPWMMSTVSHHRVAAYEQLARELHPEVFAK